MLREHEQETERAGGEPRPHEHLAPAPALAEKSAQNIEEITEAAANEQQSTSLGASPTAVLHEPIGDVYVRGHPGGGVEEPHHC